MASAYINTPLPLSRGEDIPALLKRGTSKTSEFSLHDIIREIRNIVMREKMISEDEVMKKMSKPVSLDVLREAEIHIPEIRSYSSAGMTVLLWQSSAQ